MMEYGDQVRGPWEAMSTLSALAQATDRITLGSTVVATIFRNPALLAKQAVTIDEISNGRFVLGLGAGWNQFELNAFGFPTGQLVSRFNEAFEIVRRLLRGEQLTFEGEFYTVRNCYVVPQGPRPAGPELMVGSNGARMLRITLPYVDGWNAHWSWPDFQNLPAKFAKMTQRVDEICEGIGRDPRTVWRSGTLYIRLKGASGEGIYKMPADVAPLTGRPEQLADSFAKFADAGADHLQLLIDPPNEGALEAIGAALQVLRKS
jgi:alkanesulfonate monooxygenase SsuD/methylene tetrahydromethanopterin reductase-like flavin-dependent oxidoreductase (luciferase family)